MSRNSRPSGMENESPPEAGRQVGEFLALELNMKKVILALIFLCLSSTVLFADNIKDADAYNNRGVDKYYQHDYSGAIEDYSKAIELNPKHVEAYNNRGGSYNDEDKPDKAISDCTKALEINPNYVYAYFNRGNAYSKNSKPSQAISDYNKAIEINPAYAEVYHNRAAVFFLVHDYDKAWEDVHKAQALGMNILPAFLESLKKATGKEN